MPDGKGERDKKYVGGLDSVLRVRVRPPPQTSRCQYFFHFLDYSVPNGFWYLYSSIDSEGIPYPSLFLPLFYGNVVLSSVNFKSNSNVVIKVLMLVHSLLSRSIVCLLFVKLFSS
jgi:hypothetical protein